MEVGASEPRRIRALPGLRVSICKLGGEPRSCWSESSPRPEKLGGGCVTQWDTGPTLGPHPHTSLAYCLLLTHWGPEHP